MADAVTGRSREAWRRAGAVLAVLLAMPVMAGPFAPPGDIGLRHDLELLNDSGAMNLPLTGWPLSWGDIGRGLAEAEGKPLTPAARAAWERVRAELEWQQHSGPQFELGAALAEAPRLVRTFEDTPRAEAQATAALSSWLGERVAVRLEATVAANPLDGDEVRPDGTYVALALGNWLFSAGWQERWWGPGRDGSLILSTSARPAPGFALQRKSSAPFETKWLRWIGPWSLTAFMTELDDERLIENTRVLGMRVNFKPHPSLEIGLSRTAQWCGEGRPCDFAAFRDLVLGNDNQGVNVDPDAEPGNQLAGIDMRWRLPRAIPAALYMQWIGEDTRRGGPEIGSWLRQVGIEHWGSIGGLQHRTHLEVSDTQCREGGFGFAEPKPDCAYEHGTYRTGYRYRGHSIGHAADGDSLAYSLGVTLVQSGGHRWHLSLRHAEINRAGATALPHTVSETALELSDVLLSHERLTDIGLFRFGLGYRHEEDVGGSSSGDLEAFIGWSSR